MKDFFSTMSRANKQIDAMIWECSDSQVYWLKQFREPLYSQQALALPWQNCTDYFCILGKKTV